VLPGGSRIAFEGAKTAVFRPNNPEPYLDTAERFTDIK